MYRAALPVSPPTRPAVDCSPESPTGRAPPPPSPPPRNRTLCARSPASPSRPAGIGCRRAAPGTPRCCCTTRSPSSRRRAPAATSPRRTSSTLRNPMSAAHSSTAGHRPAIAWVPGEGTKAPRRLAHEAPAGLACSAAGCGVLDDAGPVPICHVDPSICLTCDQVTVEDRARRCATDEALRRLVKACAGDWEWARRALDAAGGDVPRALARAERAGSAKRVSGRGGRRCSGQ